MGAGEATPILLTRSGINKTAPARDTVTLSKMKGRCNNLPLYFDTILLRIWAFGVTPIV